MALGEHALHVGDVVASLSRQAGPAGGSFPALCLLRCPPPAGHIVELKLLKGPPAAG